jgi:uncharacterized membrane protein YraQ (UPF0718 family)
MRIAEVLLCGHGPLIPISAELVGKGVGLGTVLALIIGGTGASIPELIILGSMFKRRLVPAFALIVFLVAIFTDYLVECLAYLWQSW